MQNARANPGSVLLKISSFVSFEIFYIEVFFKYCLAQFVGNSSRYCNKTQRQQLTKLYLLLIFDDIFLVCQYIPINIVNIHFS